MKNGTKATCKVTVKYSIPTEVILENLTSGMAVGDAAISDHVPNKTTLFDEIPYPACCNNDWY